MNSRATLDLAAILVQSRPMPNTTDTAGHSTYDPQAAESGWRATAGLRAAVEDAHLPSVDLADVSILGLHISRELLQPDVRSRFERQDPQSFDHALLDRIEPASWGLWYANTRRASLEATAGGGRVKGTTLEQALATKARMMRVCEYMLVDDPKAGLEIASIRGGTGHKDLASDLTRLAALYDGHAELLASGGGRYYDASDSAAAKASAGQILFELGEGQAKALQDAKDDAARAFVVLQDAYDRIRRWAAAIWNDDDRLPSLFSVRPSGRGQSKPAKTDAKPTTPETA